MRAASLFFHLRASSSDSVVPAIVYVRLLAFSGLFDAGTEDEKILLTQPANMMSSSGVRSFLVRTNGPMPGRGLGSMPCHDCSLHPPVYMKQVDMVTWS
jgi:hypothetical protein